jgi:hypothetical protein
MSGHLARHQPVDQPALDQPQTPAAAKRQCRIMGDEKERGAAAANLGEHQIHNRMSSIRVEITAGLIG